MRLSMWNIWPTPSDHNISEVKKDIDRMEKEGQDQLCDISIYPWKLEKAAKMRRKYRRYLEK